MERERYIKEMHRAGKTQAWIARQLGLSRQAVNQLLHPEQSSARRQVALALRKGGLTKAVVCKECGQNNGVEAHHEDYRLPLVVVWLCHPCHSRKGYKISPEQRKEILTFSPTDYGPLEVGKMYGISAGYVSQIRRDQEKKKALDISVQQA